MINGKMIVVVLPAYNAEKTIKLTVNEIDREIVSALGLINGDLQLSKKQKQSFKYETIQKLINHNFVYCGKKKISVKKKFHLMNWSNGPLLFLPAQLLLNRSPWR